MLKLVDKLPIFPELSLSQPFPRPVEKVLRDNRRKRSGTDKPRLGGIPSLRCSKLPGGLVPDISTSILFILKYVSDHRRLPLLSLSTNIPSVKRSRDFWQAFSSGTH